MPINPSWEAGRLELAQQLRDMKPREEGGWEIPAALRQRLKEIADAQWDSDRLVHTFAQQDPDQLVVLARENLVPWWVVLNGQTYFGDVAAMKITYDAFNADPGKGEKPSLNSALTWVAQPYSLGDSDKREPDPQALRQVLAWGADPNYKDSAHFAKALRTSGSGIIAAFVDYGGSLPTLSAAVAELQKDGNTAQLDRIGRALAGRTVYAKIDDNTLMTTAYMQEPGSISTLRKIFNFATERVNEIYDTGLGAGARTAMSGSSFRDFTAHELDEAREKLLSLGGRPADAFGKKRVSLGSPS